MKILLKSIPAFLIALSAHAGELNAPMKKEITVRSEIQRGLAAVAALREPEIPLYYHRAVTAIVADNQQRNEDTKGFVFGANYAAWHKLWSALSTRSFSDPFEARVAATHADICYTVALEMQKELGLSETDVRDVCADYFNTDEAKRFQAILQSKQFENSYSLASDNTAGNR
ncbi:MAG: hypothetical protein DLM52_12025 [Chthoniobacterales bacterium]|nr:MAG: hypothetical protein DLM52_12025 [Chthoniobacterales bacterium]